MTLRYVIPRHLTLYYQHHNEECITSIFILRVVFSQGYIPAEIGSLVNLTYLRLSYNAFVGTVPTKLGGLSNLHLVHLHGNRIEGTIPNIDSQFMNGQYSFITGEGRKTMFIMPDFIILISLTNLCV